mmetsp:Transcript_129980/g.259288  ORF Transcript_129980/g.259288 Transcript_129980/m.259288 type:complete len:204 (-) Transcript_129980:1002-1613(-)
MLGCSCCDGANSCRAPEPSPPRGALVTSAVLLRLSTSEMSAARLGNNGPISPSAVARGGGTVSRRRRSGSNRAPRAVRELRGKPLPPLPLALPPLPPGSSSPSVLRRPGVHRGGGSAGSQGSRIRCKRQAATATSSSIPSNSTTRSGAGSPEGRQPGSCVRGFAPVSRKSLHGSPLCPVGPSCSNSPDSSGHRATGRQSLTAT